MPLPDYQSLMAPVLQIGMEGEVRAADAVEQLADQLGLTEDERAELLPSGRQSVFANRVHWAKSYLKQAGLVEYTRRGHFRTTKRGRQALASAGAAIDRKYLQRYPEFIDFQQLSSASAGEAHRSADEDPLVSADDRTPDEIMRAAHKLIEDDLRQELLERILAAPPAFFEQLIVKLLLEMGYGGSVSAAGRALGRSGDGGVDGVIDQDALGLDRVYIQAKRYAVGNSVGAAAIRDFFGSLDRYKATKGLFVTTSAFSPDAKATVGHLSKRIVLVDGNELTRLMVRYGVGCRIEEVLYLKKLDEDFFLDE